MFHNVDVLLRVVIRWVTELLGERSGREQVLEHIDVVMLVHGRLQESFNSRLKLLVKFSDDLVSARVVVIDRFLSVVQLGSWVD